MILILLQQARVKGHTRSWNVIAKAGTHLRMHEEMGPRVRGDDTGRERRRNDLADTTLPSYILTR